MIAKHKIMQCWCETSFKYAAANLIKFTLRHSQHTRLMWVSGAKERAVQQVLLFINLKDFRFLTNGLTNV